MSIGLSPLGTLPLGLTPVAASGSSDTPVNPGVGALALTGHAPTVAQTAHQTIAPDAGSLTVTGHAPAVTQTAHQEVAPGAGALVITGYAPAVTQAAASQVITPGAGALVITGYAPTVTQSGAAASGGGFYEVPQVSRKRSVQEERERLGIIPKAVKAVLVAVAKASVTNEATDTQANALLASALAQHDIQPARDYAQFMQQERDRILAQNIDLTMRIRQRQAEIDEDEREAEMLLM